MQRPGEARYRVGTPVWQVVIAIAVGLWVLGLAALPQLIIYTIEQYVFTSQGRSAPGSTLTLVTGMAAVFMVVPTALLGWVARPPTVRAAGQAWTWAGLASAVLGAARLVPLEQHEIYLTVLATAATIMAVMLRRRGRPPSAAPAAGLVAVGCGVAVLMPWAWVGALGSLTESVLAVAAAAAIGWLAVAVLRLVTVDGSWARRVLLAGLIAVVALAPIAAGVGGTGVSLVELVVLPPLGFAAASLRRGAGALVALAAAGPLAFVDPDETALVLGTSDVGYWALVGAACALGVAVLVDVATAATYGRGVPWRRPVAAGLVAVSVIGLGVVYVGPGRPGFYGERLFVVMSTQADLAGISAIANREDRLRQTYRRLVDTAEGTQAALRRDLRRLRLGFRPYYLVNGLEVDGGPAVRAWLARRSDVAHVLLNPELRPLPAPIRPTRGDAAAPAAPVWNVDAIGVPKVWSEAGTRGAGIVIGTSDSGVDGTHPALAGSFRGGDDSWYDPWNGTRAPTDRNGHGTHTLGTALGSGGIGVAPDARWVGCVNLDRNLGNPARYLECLQFMLAPFPAGGDPMRDGRPERAPHVLTNSWGCPEYEGCEARVLAPAVSALTTAGLFFAAAAGNTGPSCGSINEEPAIDAEAFTVGAVDRNRRVAPFSSRGPVPGAAEPDVVAPGVDVLSALPGGSYGSLAGTSMAAPHVAGVVALMWSANPRLIGDIRRTGDILRSTATPATPATPTSADECGGARNVVGAGQVDAHAAVQAARAVG